MAITSRRTLGLTALAAVVILVLLDIMAAVVIGLSSSRLVEPIRRTSAIYADQSRQIRSLFFSDTVRGLVIDPELGWKYRAGWRDRTTVHNLAGLRGEREYPPHPPAGTLRVAAFGDSFVYGNETLWTESWPMLMEHADPALEVLNYGVGAYGVDQAYLRFLREGRSFAPSIVLICFTTDDLRRLVNVYRRFISAIELPLFKPRFELTEANQLRLLPSPIRSVEDYRGLLDDPRRVRTFGASDQWYERLVYENPAYDWSAMVRLVSATWIRIANRYVRHDRTFAGGVLNPESSAFRLQIAVFQAFRDSVAAAGYQPIIVFLPDRASVAARAAGGPALYAPLAAQLTSLHIPFLDAGDGFAQRPASGSIEDWFMPGGHYSREGNLVVARWLTPLLHKLAKKQP